MYELNTHKSFDNSDMEYGVTITKVREESIYPTMRPPSNLTFCRLWKPARIHRLGYLEVLVLSKYSHMGRLLLFDEHYMY
jgi:hypothetical protein